MIAPATATWPSAPGVPCEKGDEHGGMQPPTLMFCLAGVDTEKLRHSLSQDPKTYRADFIPAEYFGQNHQFIVVGLRELIQKAQAGGAVHPHRTNDPHHRAARRARSG